MTVGIGSSWIEGLPLEPSKALLYSYDCLIPFSMQHGTLFHLEPINSFIFLVSSPSSVKRQKSTKPFAILGHKSLNPPPSPFLLNPRHKANTARPSQLAAKNSAKNEYEDTGLQHDMKDTANAVETLFPCAVGVYHTSARVECCDMSGSTG